MAENDSDNPVRASETDSISLDGRRLSMADLYAVAARPDVTRVRVFALKQSLAPLAPLISLRHLELTDPYVLDGLDQLEQLESLMLYAFPRITSLDLVGTLTNLKKLMLSTPPGYDASRKYYEVESFDGLELGPFTKLSRPSLGARLRSRGRASFGGQAPEHPAQHPAPRTQRTSTGHLAPSTSRFL